MPTSMYTNAQWRMIHDDWVASGKAQTTYLNSGMCERFIKATFGSAAAVPSYATFNQHMKTISESASASASGNSTTQKKPQTPTSSVSHTSSSANKVTVSRESCSSRTAPASSSIFSPEQQVSVILPPKSVLERLQSSSHRNEVDSPHYAATAITNSVTADVTQQSAKTSVLFGNLVSKALTVAGRILGQVIAFVLAFLVVQQLSGAVFA